MNDLLQANQQLVQRRGPSNQARPFGDVALSAARDVEKAAARTVHVATPSRPANRTFQAKNLDAFSFNHLNKQQAKRLQTALDAAREWAMRRPADPGLSFVLSGGVGIGKTTIGEYLMTTCKEVMDITDPLTTEVLDSIEIMKGRLLTATRLMSLLDPAASDYEGESIGRSPLSSIFNQVRCIVLDDAGTEEIPFKKSADIEGVRHSRYREFMDYCYRNGISVIVTSNVKMLESPETAAFNPNFVNIFGEAAFDRLRQMAASFMLDLTGLPSYRLTIKG